MLIAATESTPTMIDVPAVPPENIELLTAEGMANIFALEAIKIPALNPSLLAP